MRTAREQFEVVARIYYEIKILDGKDPGVNLYEVACMLFDLSRGHYNCACSKARERAMRILRERNGGGFIRPTNLRHAA